MKRSNFDELNENDKIVVKSKLKPENKLYTSNFDKLNDTGKITVSAKSPKARELESLGSFVEQESQGLKRLFNKGDDVVGKFRGKGKLGAFAAAIMGIGSMFGSKPASASEVFKSAAEVANPLPFGRDEIQSEMDKMDPLKKLQRLKAAMQAKKK